MKLRIFCTLFLCVITTCAQANEAKRIADAIAPMMNETIAAVVHVDLNKINPDEIESKFKPLLLEHGTRFLYNFDKDHLAREIDRLKTSSSAFLKTAKTMQVQDIYFLANPSFFPGCYGYFVVPFENEAKAKFFVENYPEFDSAITIRKPFSFKNYAVMLVPCLARPAQESQTQRMLQQIVTQKPSPRPELLSLLEDTLQNSVASAAQIAVMPSGEMRHVFTEMVPTLPEPLEKFPPSFLTRGIHWGVVSLDFTKPEIRGVIRSENPQAAKDLHNMFEFLLQRTLDDMEKEVVFSVFLETSGMTHKEFSDAAKAFLPNIQGDELRITFNENMIKTRGKRLLEVSGALSETALMEVRRRKCTENMQIILLAFHNYHDVHTQLPAAWTVGKDKKPLHSWRVAVLPYIEQMALYGKIRHDEPWDSEYNRQFHNQCPKIFQCPQAVANNPEIAEKGLTTYSIIVGKNAYPEGEKRYEFQMIQDGLSNTFAVVERKKPVNWMDPTQEITQENAEKGINKSPDGIGAWHSAGKHFGTNAALFDGSVHFFTENLRLKVLRVFVERNDAMGYDENNMYDK